MNLCQEELDNAAFDDEALEALEGEEGMVLATLAGEVDEENVMAEAFEEDYPDLALLAEADDAARLKAEAEIFASLGW
jgi:hypothetical protein